MSRTVSRRGAALQPPWQRVLLGDNTAWPWLSLEPQCPKETSFLSQSHPSAQVSPAWLQPHARWGTPALSHLAPVQQEHQASAAPPSLPCSTGLRHTCPQQGGSHMCAHACTSMHTCAHARVLTHRLATIPSLPKSGKVVPSFTLINHPPNPTW